MSSQDNNGPRDPWGSRSNAPPDFELLITRRVDTLKRILPGGSPRAALAFIILIIVVASIWSSYYTVPSDSVAVVQRFGKHY